MALSERGRTMLTTSAIGQVAGATVAWRRGNGVLVSLLGGLIGGFAGLFAGKAVADAQHLAPGLVTAGPDNDAPERAIDGSEIDGYVDNSQRPYYDLLATSKVASEDKFAPYAFIRTTPAPSFTAQG